MCFKITFKIEILKTSKNESYNSKSLREIKNLHVMFVEGHHML